MPDLDDLFLAADEYAVNAGDVDHAVGDLQAMPRAAWRVLTPWQRMRFLDQPEMQGPAETPEYRPLIGDRGSGGRG